MASEASPQAEVAARVWSALQAFVAAHDRRRELQEALDLGRGLGRVKVLVLLQDGPSTLREIAEATAVDAPYATVIVDKLVGRGLVERTAHPDDNRRKLVALTATGRETAALAQRILLEPPEELVALAPSDLAALDEAFNRLAPMTSNRAPTHTNAKDL